MEQVALVARNNLEYPPGRRLKAGQRFEATPEDARLLTTILRIADPVKVHVKEVTAEPLSTEADEPTKAKRQYKRRDLTPEP